MPFLIVVPSSLIANWEQEFQHWAPSLKLTAYKGTADARAALFARQVALVHVLLIHCHCCICVYTLSTSLVLTSCMTRSKQLKRPERTCVCCCRCEASFAHINVMLLSKGLPAMTVCLRSKCSGVACTGHLRQGKVRCPADQLRLPDGQERQATPDKAEVGVHHH